MKAKTQFADNSTVTVYLQAFLGTIVYFAFAALSLGLNSLI
jgi:hypothetical protein